MKKIILSLFLIVSAMLFINCNSDEELKENITIDIDDDIDDDIGDDIGDTIDDDTKEHTTGDIVWKNWYLSVPVDRGDDTGKAISIYHNAIENDSLTDVQKEFFYKNVDSSYTFYTKFTGYTTSGEYELNEGKYSRTELREFWQGNQDVFDNWYMNDGTHEMESTLQVNSCGGNGQTYVAQIHAKRSPTLSGSPPTVKVQWQNGDIVIEYYVKPDNGIWNSNFEEKITIGTVGHEKFTIRLIILDGKLHYALSCSAKNINQQYQSLYDYVGNGYDFDNYFKTGNYFKWDADYTESSEVILYSVKTSHN